MRYHRITVRFLAFVVTMIVFPDCCCNADSEDPSPSLDDKGECMNDDNGTSASSSSSTTTDIESVSCQDENQECRAAPQKTSSTEECQNKILLGECISNQEFMFQYCPQECLEYKDFGVYGYLLPKSEDQNNKPCQDDDEYCKEDAKANECLLNPDWMLKECPKSCLVCFEEKEDG